MDMLLIVSGVLAMLTAVIHGGPGVRTILRPTLAAPVSRVVQATGHGAWHLLTWHFALLGAASIAAPWMPTPTATAIAWFVGVNALG